MARKFRVYVFGRFRLHEGETVISVSSRLRRPRELLQALIAFGGSEVSATVLIDALWDDSDGDAAYHALESTLYRLRRLLGSRHAVRMDSGKVTLNRELLWIDAWQLDEDLTNVAAEDPVDRVASLRRLYQGHFLVHEAERPWILNTRQEFRDRLLRAIRDAAHECERLQRWEDAAAIYRSGIELDSLNEGLYRGLMSCHQELGDHSEAVHAYRRCSELLMRFLGIPPNAKTQALYRSVRERASFAAIAG
jgi:LuxR family transcriptional regulator, maltose regulon positive regulatory protein